MALASGNTDQSAHQAPSPLVRLNACTIWSLSLKVLKTVRTHLVLAPFGWYPLPPLPMFWLHLPESFKCYSILISFLDNVSEDFIVTLDITKLVILHLKTFYQAYKNDTKYFHHLVFCMRLQWSLERLSFAPWYILKCNYSCSSTYLLPWKRLQALNQ